MWSRATTATSSTAAPWPLPPAAPLKLPKDHRGVEVIQDPLYNKGMAFDYGERDRLGLRGLMPPCVSTLEEQCMKTMVDLRGLPDDLSKHMFLVDLHDRNETLFHRVVVRHVGELAPLIYTPTVGQACLEFGNIFRRPRGMYFSANDVGHMNAMVQNWPMRDVRVVVVTDGSRILGLGDLGANGMGIPIGKLALYCAAGGIAPHRVLPVVVDVGTNNDALRDDPFYLGLRQARLTGAAYDDVLDEFVAAVRHRWPKCLIQFEDFESAVAQPLLDRFRDDVLCFNDDIQGTGATVLAGSLACLRQTGKPPSALTDQRVVVAGAGSAGVGVATALKDGMVSMGLSEAEAASKFYLFDVDGLVAKEGMDPAAYDALVKEVRVFADSFDAPGVRGDSLKAVIEATKPTMLIGLSTVGGLFTEDIVKTFHDGVKPDRPIVMPLSNPTASAECSAADAITWTDGAAVFASGSPFPPVEYGGKTYQTSQCNNMFVFPGVGLGATVAECTVVSDDMLHAAAEACANSVSDDEMARGQVFPDVARIRDVSLNVAVAVIESALKAGYVRSKPILDGADVRTFVQSKSYFPAYVPIVQAPLGDAQFDRSPRARAWAACSAVLVGRPASPPGTSGSGT
ncbi:malate dehydrogenase [Aureococcus anophagefferens]|nr:malate dehydrogenase [Aureococcus anophagefferens]